MGIAQWIGAGIGFLVGGPAGAVAGFAIGSVKPVAKLVDKALDFVIKPFMKLFGVPDMPDIGNETRGQEGFLVTRDGSNENIPVIYGFRQTGGVITFMETGGVNGKIQNRYLWVGYALCEGPIEGLKTLAIDDRDLPESIVARLNTGETVDITGLDPAKDPAAKYNGVTKLKFWHGLWYDPANSSPLPAQLKENIFKDCPNTDNNLDAAYYNGCAALFARYEIIERTTEEAQNNNPFGGGIPQIQVGIMGRKVMALATNVYVNGVLDVSATNTMNSNVNTWWLATSLLETIFDQSFYLENEGRYSTNPAECLFDYLRNPNYGKGIRMSDMHLDSWKKAANKCNQFVSYYTGARGPILTMNYIVDTSQTLMTNTKNMLAGFRAYMPYVQGQYKIKIDDAGNDTDILSGVASIVQTITRDEIVGDVTYTGIERTNKYNHVTVKYADLNQKWSTQEVVWPETEAERQLFIAEDSGLENKGDFTAYTLTNPIMALDYARLIFNKSRYQESCSFTMSAQGFELEPGDNVYIQSNILNFGTIPWRVISTTLGTNYTFDVQCVRNPDNIYPYGRYNEPDIVRPPYIPRQNEIYLPNVNRPRLDIFPPSYAPLPAGWTGNLPPGTPTPTNPTNPGDGTSPGGGGVGSGGGAIDGGSTITNPPAPKPAEPVVRTDHIIVFTGSTFNAATNSYTVTFTIPDGILYGGVKIWWRPASISSYFEMADLSSGARSFTFQSPSSFAQQHYVVARLKYSNGEYSTNRNKATLYGAADGIYGQGIDNSELVVQDPTVINQNAAIEMVSMNVVTPLTTPRSMIMKIKEPIVRDQLPNRNIERVLFYYRNASMPANQYYLYDKFTPPTGYLGNAEFTVPLSNLFDANYTDWSIIVRWRFTNGTLGNYVYRQNIRTDVDNTGIVGGYTATIPTITLAPDPAITNNTASLTSVFSIQRGTGTDKMQIHFANPSLAPISMVNWAGVRVDYAVADPGYTLTYKTLNFPTSQCFSSGIVPNPGGFFVQITDANFSQSKNYHIIVTLAYTSGGSTLYSSRAIKYTGGYFGGQDFNQIGITNGLQLQGSATDYLTLKSEYSSTPIPGQAADKQVVGVTRVEGLLTNSPINSANALEVTLGVPHFRIAVNIPTGLTIAKVRVYRRFNSGTNVGQMEFSDYTGLTTGENLLLFRLGRNNLPSSQVDAPPFDKWAFSVTPAFSWQDVYVRIYTGAGAGTASNAVVRVTNTGNPGTFGVWTNITPATYNSMNSIIDVTADTALNTLLNGAIQTDGGIEVPNAGASRVKWAVPITGTFGNYTRENSGFRK